MLLKDLARAVDGRLIGDGDIEISSIEHDSRSVTSGALFVAVPGFTVDGHAYLGRAAENGSPAVVVQEDRKGMWKALVEGAGVDLLVLKNTRRGMAQLAAALHGYPARKLNVIGITGTDGKTSLAHLVAHVFTSSGKKAGLISTAECRIGNETLADTGRFTTPESPQVQSMLAQMVAARCDWAVIEATSHGLALHRVDECEYDIATFTNLGVDHIDFHGGEDEYRASKGRLFQMLDESIDKGVPKTAVLNADDQAFDYMQSLTAAKVATYGIDRPADFHATGLQPDGQGTRFRASTPRATAEVFMPMPGRFNVYNALAALAIGSAAKLPLDAVTRAIASWPGAPGRTEFISQGQPFTVLVDFAHAPDSLRRVLRMLRESVHGRVIAAFGCIGERDKVRRPGMARVAAELADYTFITDDNPYTEDRDAILTDIASEMRAVGKRDGHDFSVVPDRREAIAQALSMAVDEDAVLLAGKGHEREVHLKDSVYECDDREVARRVLREMGYHASAS
ncbi:MAG: UDP-N-acetylmuramoyl-L-alanyl-D-glutamate--2,6-diaminopimelate ligase [Dehalococcoidia bacterium]